MGRLKGSQHDQGKAISTVSKAMRRKNKTHFYRF